jgi:hypothetical protein
MVEHGSTRIWLRLFCRSYDCRLVGRKHGVIEVFVFPCYGDLLRPNPTAFLLYRTIIVKFMGAFVWQ